MFFIAPGQVAVDAAASGDVVAVVRVVETEAFQGSEVGFNGVKPTGIGWCPDETDIVLPCEFFQSVMAVG